MYDSIGRVIGGESAFQAPNSDLEPLGAPTRIVYNEEGEVVLSGQDIDGNGRLEEASNDRISRSETEHEQDEHGHWWRITKSWTWPKTNDATKVKVSEVLSRETGFTENSDETLGRLVSETIQKNANLASTTSLAYLNRETGETTTIQRKPDFEITTVSIAGLVKSVTQKSSVNSAPSVIHHQYDALGRRIASINPRTGKTTVEYDPVTGQIWKTTDAAGNATTYDYYGPEEQNAGKLKSTTNALGKTQSFTYNARGQKITSSGETDYPTCHEYDDYGQLVKLITFREEPIKQIGEGDLAGPPTRAQMLASIGKPDVTTWVHDEATGVLLEKIYADGKGPKHDHHPDGRMKTRTWARGAKTHYDYDPQTLAQIKVWYEETSKPGGQSTTAQTSGVDPVKAFENAINPKNGNDSAPNDFAKTAPIIFEHNRAGQVIAVTDAEGRRTFERDEFGREIAEILPDGQRIERNYADDSGALAVVELFDSDRENVNQTDYSYNPNGTLASAQSGGDRFEYGYVEEAPNLLASIKGPVAKVTYAYEENRNLVTEVHNVAQASLPANSAEAQPISTFTYTNDEIGRRSAVEITGPSAENSGWDWGYNDRSELVSADPANPEFGTYSYHFNGLGNRESATEGHVTTAYQTNALNQYTSIEQVQRERITPEYDLDGNLIKDDQAIYTWNANNRLVRVEKKSGVVSTYQYDYMGRRTRKTVRQPDGSTTRSEFVYDGWNVIAEFETTETKHQGQSTKNSATRYYTWGRDLSGTLQGAGGVGGLLSIRIENDSESELLYPAYDANGNITEVVDDNGKVRAAFQYGPFGNLISEAGDLAEQILFRFSTKYFDRETGFSYYGFRYYIPESGRWLSRDPIEENGGPNYYNFVSNDPPNSLDLLGMLRKKELKADFTDSPFGKRISYSCKCGWIDWGHANGKAATAVIEAIKDGSTYKPLANGFVSAGLPSQTGNGFRLTYALESTVGNSEIEYFIKYNLEDDEKLKVALAVFRDFSLEFETSQAGGWLGLSVETIGKGSSFSVDDLPSNIVGFYRKAVSGLDDVSVLAKVCDALNEADSLKTWKELYGRSGSTSEKNHDFVGVRHKNVSCCKGKNRDWPKEFQTITPAGGSQWRRWGDVDES